MCLLSERGFVYENRRSPARVDCTVSIRELADFAAFLKLIDKSLDQAIKEVVRRSVSRGLRQHESSRREGESNEDAERMSDAMLELVI